MSHFTKKMTAHPNAPSLAEIFLSHTGHLSDKWEHYLAIYEAELARFANSERPVALLEIGVQNGGSLQIWKKLLPPGSSITGMDINSDCAKLDLGQGIQVLVGDATVPAEVEHLLGTATFDVIIDDGSHRSDHVISSFIFCANRLNPGGLYFIEDLHCSYKTDFGGGFRAPGSAIEWFKKLADALNVDHFGEDAEANTSAKERMILHELGLRLARVSFYDSLVVVETLTKPRAAPYRRVVAGHQAPVVDIVGALPETAIRELESLLLSSTGWRKRLARARKSVDSLRIDVMNLQEEKAAIVEQLSAARNEANTAQSRLQAIENSTTWQSTQLLRAGLQHLPLAARQVLSRSLRALMRMSRSRKN